MPKNQNQQVSEPNGKDIMQKFRQAQSQRMQYENLWSELDKFDRGEQWNDANMPTWVPKPVTNFIHLVKSTKRASLALRNPVGKLMAVVPDEIDKVDQLQKVYEYEFRKSRASLIVRDAIETALLLGTGIVQVYWNNDTGVRGGEGGLYEGQIGIKQIDPSSFYPDPSATRIDECQYIHIVDKVPLSWLKNQRMFKDAMKDVQPRELANEDTGDIYERNQTADSRKGLIDFRQHFEKVKVIEKVMVEDMDPNTGEIVQLEAEEERFVYRVTYLAGDKVLKTLPLKPNCYPFAVLYDYPQRKDFWGKSTCMMILDNQKLINKVESIIALIGTQLQNPQRVVSNRSGINPNEVAMYGGAPNKTWVANGDPSKAIYVIPPQTIPPVLFELANQAAANIREISGMNEAYTGDSVGSLTTSSGVQALIDRATVRDQDKMLDIEAFVEDITRLFIKFITEFHIEPRFIRVNKPQGQLDSPDNFVQYTGTDFKGLDFDFFINASEDAPISRQRRKQELIQLLNMQGQYQFDPPVITGREFVKMYEFMDSDELVRRMDEDEFNSLSAIMTQIVQAVEEAVASGVPADEVANFANQMLQQKLAERNQATGNVSNSGQMQQQQAGVNNAIPNAQGAGM